MAPRRYQMSTRAVAVGQTRQHIVAQAIRLFAEQTAAVTSMEQIARAAGVSPATVYRHFGDFDSLAEACAQTAFAIAEIPSPEQAVQQFADLQHPDDKLHRFIGITCHCYERAEEWLAAERRERHLPAFARTVAREEAALEAIVRGLLEPAGADADAIGVVKALVDFPFWQSLVTGVPRTAAPAVMHRLVTDYLRSTGISLTDKKREAHVPNNARRSRPAPR